MSQVKEIDNTKTGSLAMMRKYLQGDCGMLQLWAGKSEGDRDYIVFMSKDLAHFAILTSPGGSSVYAIADSGDIIFMHGKNMKKLAKDSDTII